MTSTGIAAPPETQTSSADTSASAARRSCSIAAYIVGTPSKTVTRSRSMISSALPASKRGSSVRRPADGDRGVERARLAEGVEERQRAERDGALVEPEQADGRPRRCAAGCSCVSSAPFGVPVVPDV